jgi:glycosyltransferase involved in cell wall biosynthesis
MTVALHKTPLISVIITTYNHGHFIEYTIESVLNQTFSQKDLEIIVVDDGSTDDTPARVGKYKDKITYIYQKNNGHVSACNVGFEIASGEILAFLDSDDYFVPHKLSLIADKFARSESVDFLCHDVNIVDGSRTPIENYFDYVGYRVKNDGKPERVDRDGYLSGQLFLSAPTTAMAFRTSCLRKVFPIPAYYVNTPDVYLLHSVLFYAREFVVIKEPLSCYRIHGSNIFADIKAFKEHKHTNKQLKAMIRTYTLLIQDISRLGRDIGCDVSGLKRRLERRIDHWNRNLYWWRKIPFYYASLRKEGLSICLLRSYRRRQIATLVKNNGRILE